MQTSIGAQTEVTSRDKRRVSGLIVNNTIGTALAVAFASPLGKATVPHPHVGALDSNLLFGWICMGGVLVYSSLCGLVTTFELARLVHSSRRALLLSALVFAVATLGSCAGWLVVLLVR